MYLDYHGVVTVFLVGRLLDDDTALVTREGGEG